MFYSILEYLYSTRKNKTVQIAIGICIGALLGYIVHAHAIESVWFAQILTSLAGILMLCGDLFVGALRAIAPVLVFILVTSSIASYKSGSNGSIHPVLFLYFLGTLCSAFISVALSFYQPIKIALKTPEWHTGAPSNIGEVFHNLALNIVDNPVHALIEGNYVGILAWAIAFGLTLRSASASTKGIMEDLTTSVSEIVSFVIRLAPIGISGLVTKTFVESGFDKIHEYTELLKLLLTGMLLVALVLNPLIVYLKIRRNPYQLIILCLKESGVPAFFTRSSAANIPVNIALCERLKLNKDFYSLTIPLGAIINMSGAAVTITVLTLAAVHTLGIHVDLLTALLLSIVASVSACGVAGIAGGSLLLLPLSCSLFGIDNDTAMQIVGVGFVLSVIQDSVETALNSSTDVVFTAAAHGSEHFRGLDVFKL